MNTCLTCANFSSCKNIRRASNFLCDDFMPLTFDKKAGVFEFLDEAKYENAQTKTKTQVDDTLLLNDKKLDSAFSKMEYDLEEALNSNLPVPKDFKFDDSELPLAKNIFDFITNPVYGFEQSTLFSRQLWIAVKLFGEYCQPCTLQRSAMVQGKTKKIMKNVLNIPIGFSMFEFVEKVQLLEHGVCPNCKKTRLDLYKEKQLKFYTELAECAGQRSGKSILTSFLFAYHTHRILKLQKPAELLTGAANTLLTLSMVSIDKRGVMNNLWLPYYAALDDSKWFQQYHSM